MKRFYLLTFFMILALSAIAQQDILTNETIIEMVEMGFSDEIIISKIDECPNTFDTSIEALKNLKQNKVSEAVIVSIVSAAKNSKALVIKAEALKEGIFYLNSNGQEQEIMPTVISSTKRSFGAWTDKLNAFIPYSSSPNKIPEGTPTFVFYFNRSNQNSNFSSGIDNWWFKIASSPNEFVLLQMEKQKNNRKIRIGESGPFDPTITHGIDNKKAIPFTIKKISDSKYEVVPQNKLKKGEYCFFYQGHMPNGVNNQSVFDFSVE